MPSCHKGLGTRYARYAVSQPGTRVNSPAPRQPDYVANTLSHRIVHRRTCVAWPVEQGDRVLTKLFGNG